MNTLNNRIEFLVNKHAQGNKSKFSVLVGTSEANVRNYVSGKSTPKIEVIMSIVNIFEITYEWLLEGKEVNKPKKQKEGNNDNVTKNVTLNVAKLKEQKEGNNYTEHKNITASVNEPKAKYKEPILVEATGKANVILLNAHAAASDFSQALTNPVYAKDFETLCLPPFMHRKGTFYAVSVTGDSMHPTITHKDIVAGSLKQTTDFVSGSPYVFYHETEGLMVKRFYWNRKEYGELSLRSDNESVNEFITNVDEISTYLIKVEYKMSDNLRNWNSDIRNDIREMKQAISRLEAK